MTKQVDDKRIYGDLLQMDVERPEIDTETLRKYGDLLQMDAERQPVDAETIRKYGDLLEMDGPRIPANRPRMSVGTRGAQFAPFAALTGYEAAIAETGRRTEEQGELSEDDSIVVNERLALLLFGDRQGQSAAFTYFVPDSRKAGGAYVTVRGTIKKYEDVEGALQLSSGKRIPIQDIVEIDLD